MTRTRRIGAVAAIGTLTAAAALLSGLSARADELADLKANQELLQKRVDQLALGAPNPVAPGSPSMAGSFPRSILIPGTDTSLLIGGYVKLDVTDYLSGSGVNGNAATSLEGAPVISGVPLDLKGGHTGPTAPLFLAPAFNPHSRGNGAIQFTAKESRLRVETRTPTAWGEAQTVFEFDFYGCQSGGADCDNLNHTSNANVPRLRLAYGTLGAFEAGQNWVPVFDLDAHAELFDFGGDFGAFGYARAPQLGYKWVVPWMPGVSFGAYAVYPTTTVNTAAGQLATDSTGVGVAGTSTPPIPLAVNPTKSTLPDGNFVLRWQQPWGHFQVSAIIQQLELQDGAFISKDYIGYGGGFGMNVKPLWFGWDRDNFGAEFFAGSGLDRYASDGTGTDPVSIAGLATNFGGLSAGCYGATASTAVNTCGAAGPTTAANAKNVLASTFTQFGGQANYQHWWMPGLRSNASFGLLHEDVPTTLVGPVNSLNFSYNKELVSAHLNLIWSPVAFINTGIEYTFGHRETIWNQKGDENAVNFAFQVKF